MIPDGSDPDVLSTHLYDCLGQNPLAGGRERRAAKRDRKDLLANSPQYVPDRFG